MICLSKYSWHNEFAHDAPPLEEGSPAPSIVQINEFLRFHAAASRGRGRIDLSGRITADSCLSFTEDLYAGFQSVRPHANLR